MVHSWAENMWIESCSPHGGGGHFARAEKIMPLFILHIGSPSGPSASSTNDSAPSNFGRIRKMFCVCHSERHSRTRTHTQSVTKCSVGEPFLPIHSLNLLCSVNRRLRSYFSVFVTTRSHVALSSLIMMMMRVVVVVLLCGEHDGNNVLLWWNVDVCLTV